jgi:hypothetical protein
MGVEKPKMKRVNVIIPEQFYDEVHKRGHKLSGIIREALEDALNPHTITISVTEETKSIYHELFSKTECNDKEFEPFLKDALKNYITYLMDKREDRLAKMKSQLDKAS